MGIYHANTVHMSHFGRSGTLLAVSDTLVHTRVHSNPRLRYAVIRLGSVDKVQLLHLVDKEGAWTAEEPLKSFDTLPDTLLALEFIKSSCVLLRVPKNSPGLAHWIRYSMGCLFSVVEALG